VTPDPFSAALDQLAACRERGHRTRDPPRPPTSASSAGQLTQLARMVPPSAAPWPRTPAAMARLDALKPPGSPNSRPGSPGAARNDGGRRLPAAPRRRRGGRSPPTSGRPPSRNCGTGWSTCTAPGYGHLAVLGTCWPEHDLLPLRARHPQPAVVRPLPPARPQHPACCPPRPNIHARILPALASQLATETSSCSHAPTSSYPGARR